MTQTSFLCLDFDRKGEAHPDRSTAKPDEESGTVITFISSALVQQLWSLEVRYKDLLGPVIAQTVGNPSPRSLGILVTQFFHSFL